MKQFLTVFKFEYLNFVKNKIFIALTVAIAIIIAVVSFYPRFSSGSDVSINLGNQETPSLLVIDKANIVGLEELLKETLSQVDISFSSDGDETSAKLSVEKEEYDSAIVINSPIEYTYIVKNLGLYDTTEQAITRFFLHNIR